MADNIVVKIVSDASQLKETNKVLAETGKISSDTEKKFSDLQKATTKADDSFKSLKTQIKEAKNEAQQLSQKFGENSAQARNAAQRVAGLTEDLDDFNNRVKALNPESKFNALNNVLTGTIGAFQGLTGALQLFGGESEEVQRIAAKLQGFLNLTQGLNSVLGLKDAFKDLRLVLTASTTAQAGLTAANEAEAASATVASNANRGLMASLGPILLVVGAIAAAYYIWKSAQEEVAVNTDKLLDQFEEFKKNQELQLSITKEQGASEVELLGIRQANNKVYQEQLASIMAQMKEEKDREAIQKQINDLKREEQLLLVQNEIAIRNATKAELEAAQAAREKVAANQAALKAQFDAEIQAKIGNVDKQVNLNKKINAAQSQDNQDRINRDLVSEIQGLEEKKKIYEEFSLDTQEIDADLFLARKNLRDKEIEEERAAARERASNSEQAFAASFGLIVELSRNSTQRQLQDVQELYANKKISEEEYQKRLKIIKTNQAKDEKAFAIFEATIGIAKAIIAAIPKGAQAIALASFIGAAQLAIIASKPIPKFKKGTLNVLGGNGGVDDVPAYLNRGEAVIPTEINKEYSKTIGAIFNRQISATDINNFVHARTGGSAMSVNATINPYDLARGLKRSRRELETQATLTGRVIAKELSSSTNIRHVI
jgi:hypothetical protein